MMFDSNSSKYHTQVKLLLSSTEDRLAEDFLEDARGFFLVPIRVDEGGSVGGRVRRLRPASADGRFVLFVGMVDILLQFYYNSIRVVVAKVIVSQRLITSRQRYVNDASTSRQRRVNVICDRGACTECCDTEQGTNQSCALT